MADLIGDDSGAIDLPEKGGGVHRVHSWEIEAWQKSEAWGRVNVRGELEKMRTWLLENPAKRKIKTRVFVISWMNRASDRPGRIDPSVGQTAYRDRVQRAHHEEMRKPAARAEVARAALAEAMRILRS